MNRTRILAAALPSALAILSAALTAATPAHAGANADLVRQPALQQALRLHLKAPVQTRSDLHAITLLFTLDRAAAPEIALGERHLRPGECFARDEPRIIRTRAPQPVAQHRVTFNGLAMNQRYTWAVRLDSGQCENGAVYTATRIDE